MSPRRLPFLAVATAALCTALVLGAGGAGAAGGNPPHRDHGHGAWFKSVCSPPAAHLAECGAQVVTDEAGLPLASGSPPATAYGPSQFHGGYSLPTLAPGTPTIGIVDAYNDPNIESDLAVYDTQYGLPSCTTANGCFRKVNQSGGTSYPSNNSGWSLEIALDVETAHEICQNCKILLVEASSSSFANLGAAENEAVKLGANVVSNSWGGSEWSGETADDAAYFDHPEVPITVSAGDSGYGVEYPASSQYVTAVGGTTLSLTSGGGYADETVWSGTGSGCSAYEPKPSWQHDSGCSHRSVADVAADADPNTGAAVYDSVSYSGQSGWFQVGGTSLASPLIAATYALAGNPAGVDFGAAPYGDAGALHDVVSGSNGTCSPSYLCKAQAGYDGPTGLGSPSGTGAFAPQAATQDFSLSTSPSSLTVTAGSGGTTNVVVSSTGGFAGSVSLSAAGLPTGVTPMFGSSTVQAPGSTTLTLTASSTAAPGTYTVTITGTTSGGPTHTTTLSLTVKAAAIGDFSLSVSPSQQTLKSPGTVRYTVTVSPMNGFTGQVSLGVTGVPSGLSSSWSLNPTGSTSTLTITASSRHARTTATLTITGMSGTLTHSVPARLSVR